MMVKELFKGKYKVLSNNDRVVYSVLRERFELSIKNGWVDAEDNIFFYFEQSSLAEECCISLKTVQRSMQLLIEIGLVESVRQGNNKPNRLYLLKPEYTKEKAEERTDTEMPEKAYKTGVSADESKSPVRTGQNDASRGGQVKMTRPDESKCPTSKTKESNTELNNLYISSSSKPEEDDDLEQAIDRKTEISISGMTDAECRMVQNVRSIIKQLFLKPPDFFKAGTEQIMFDAELQRQMLEYLKPSVFRILVKRILSNPEPVKNPRAFLAVCLYNGMLYGVNSRGGFHHMEEREYDFTKLEEEILSN